ncbi:MAG: hypothetical protein U0Q12_22115 [Vicinamibacterales bacterium]
MTPKHLAVRQALHELTETGGRISDSAVAERAGIDRHTLGAWRQNPAFNAWLEESFGVRNYSKNVVAARAVALAMQGSIDHMNWLAKVFGWFKQGDPDVGGRDGLPEIHVHV